MDLGTRKPEDPGGAWGTINGRKVFKRNNCGEQ